MVRILGKPLAEGAPGLCPESHVAYYEWPGVKLRRAFDPHGRPRPDAYNLRGAAGLAATLVSPDQSCLGRLKSLCSRHETLIGAYGNASVWWT